MIDTNQLGDREQDPARARIAPPAPVRVWALPDGRIAVRVPNVAPDTWLLIDHWAGTIVARGELAADAREMTAP